MKLKYILLFFAALICAKSIHAQGVKVIAPVITNSASDEYPTHIDSLGMGGFMSVTSLTLRNNIPALRRKKGMMVFVTETDQLFQLRGGTDNSNWVTLSLSAGGSGTFSWAGSAASHPSSPTLYTAYYNSTDKISYIWDGDSWEILAKDGSAGAQGPQGVQGPTGLQGPAGTNGISIVWQGSLASAPSSPQLNWGYYNSTDKKSYVWDGDSWEILSQDGNAGVQGPQGVQGPAGTNGISIVWQGTLASSPSSPQLNWGYYNSTDKKSYVWDGDSWEILSQDGSAGAQGPAGTNGISIVWQGTLASAPSSPQLNWGYYNSADKKSYMWDGDSWEILSQDGATGTNGVSIVWQGSLASAPSSPQLNWGYYNSTDKKSYVWDGDSWEILSQDGSDGLGSSTFNGSRPITASVFTNQNPGTNDVAAWLEYLFYPSQTPTATLTMTYSGNTQTSFTLEQMATGAALSANLNWTAGRQATTATLSTISVGGQSQTFSQPAQGASVNGVQAVTFSRNTNVTLSNIVLTTDSKSAQANVTISFSWRRYYGFVTQPGGVSEGEEFTPTPAEILALANQPFASSRGFSATVNPSGSQRLVIAYPVAWDPGPTTSAQISIGGFVLNTDAYRREVISFTNASGGIQDYVVYTMKNNTSAFVSLTVQ